MTTYYIDPDNGSDSTGDGTEANPYRKGPSQAGAAVPNALGNTYLFKRGTVMSEGLDSTFTGNAANEGQRVTYGAYGSADNPPRIDVAGAAAYCIQIQNKERVTVQDFDLYGSTNVNMRILNNVTRACSYTQIKRVRAYGSAFDGISMTAGNNAGGVAPSPALGVVFDGCEGHRNGQHGVAVIAYATGAIIKNCYATGNSLTSSGWGVYHGGQGVTYTGASGWTIAGNVKSRTSAMGIKPYGVWSGNTTSGVYELAENAGTPTTPGTGEWGYNGTTVYVNIGAPSGGYSIAIIFQPNTNAVLMDCRGDDHLLFDAVGVGMDRGVYGGRILRSRGSGNLGSVVQVNQAKDITVDGVLGVGNREAVYMSSIGGTCVVKGVTSADLTYGVRGERVSVGASLDFSNNLLISSTAILVATNNGTVTNDYNAYTGSLSGVSAGAHDITADPLLTSNYRPTVSSPLIGAGTHLGYTRDLDKKQRQNPPSIGAYDAATMISG